MQFGPSNLHINIATLHRNIAILLATEHRISQPRSQHGENILCMKSILVPRAFFLTRCHSRENRLWDKWLKAEISLAIANCLKCTTACDFRYKLHLSRAQQRVNLFAMLDHGWECWCNSPKNCQRPRYRSKYLVNKRLAKGSGENG